MDDAHSVNRRSFVNLDQRRARSLGLLLAVLLMLAPFVARLPARAQAAGDLVTEPATVSREAYFTAEADGAVPATLVNEFPPGIACILVPQACSSTTAPITGPISDNLPDPELPDYQAPQPVEDGTLPVGMLGGKPRYTSYLKLELPKIPEGSIIDRFDLVLTETAVSYALESPAFRQAVLAGLVTYQTRSPAEFTRFVGDVAARTTPLAQVALTGIEICAVTKPWPAGPSQDAALQPPRDCVFGANGERDAEEGLWTFDLSLLAQSWLDGTVANEGIYLGPIGAENLAFGDPDTSTNWQVSLGGKEAADDSRPMVVYSFSEGFADDELGEDLVLEDEVFEDTAFDEVVPSSDPFSVDVDESALDGTEDEVATAPPVDSPPLRGSLAAESRPRTPWWLWLLLPLGAALYYAFARAFEEDPPASRAGQGALSRLMAGVDQSPGR